ncbi:B2 bradykinin receptor-like [Dendropsophus ebraccatus]|uniref:B2 bradykinin receptor-like n=1 Tax=Dendropsophus ebraccatus TaxID=150705 RepID=UPI00383225F6
MMSTEPNGTMTTFANITDTPKKACVDQGSFGWLYTYQPHYMWSIFVLGFIENLFVISVFALYKSRCTVTEIYLGNMAATTLIYVSSLPFRAVHVSNRFHWTFGSFMCSAVVSAFQLNFYSSIYFLMMVSIERYLALVKPMSVSHLRRPWGTKVTCGIIWVFAVGISVPNGVFRKVEFNEKLNTTDCVNDKTFKKWYISVNSIRNILGFLVPLVVITFCTSQMIRALINNPMRQFKKVNKEKKATWLVLSVLLIFMLCWIPYNISIFIMTLDRFNVFLSCKLKSINDHIYQMSYYMVLSNSCINPVLYCMVGNNFRQKAREVYGRLLCGLDCISVPLMSIVTPTVSSNIYIVTPTVHPKK